MIFPWNAPIFSPNMTPSLAVVVKDALLQLRSQAQPLPSRACARPRNWAISLNTVSTLFPARRAWRTIYRQTARAQNGPACPDPLPLIQVSHKAT